MWPDRVSNPGPLTYMYESGALPTALRGPAIRLRDRHYETENNISDIVLYSISKPAK